MCNNENLAPKLFAGLTDRESAIMRAIIADPAPVARVVAEYGPTWLDNEEWDSEWSFSVTERICHDLEAHYGFEPVADDETDEDDKPL